MFDLRRRHCRVAGGLLLAPLPNVAQAALRWQPQPIVNAHQTYSMPGKHIADATTEPCRRCKDNISVLVVRSEPLCQSVSCLVEQESFC